MTLRRQERKQQRRERFIERYAVASSPQQRLVAAFTYLQSASAVPQHHEEAATRLVEETAAQLAQVADQLLAWQAGNRRQKRRKS